MQANLVDLIILALLVLSGLVGLRQGFVKSFGGLFGTIGAFIIALLFSDDLVLLLEEKFGLRTAVADAVAGHLPVTALPLPIPRVLEYELTAPTPADFLAQFILILACFLLITFVGARLIAIIFGAANALVSWGILGWFNSGLGLALVIVKNLLIITILLGLLRPAIQLAANLNYAGAQAIMKAMNDSYLVPKLLYIFALLKAMLGMDSGA
ncbi:MAG: CvpA family protein [Syntrophomonadaceae bacterium]|nr:CvpA family protein [Bacillota bacterium]NLM89078.1 hypothetical protein [Syntrophomonadaceae bacterium]HAA08295.1 hypothetical protein [Syntrophomonas sp.]HQD91072.1 CvpA family protein [Syntrophomonadaceae bacterium]